MHKDTHIHIRYTKYKIGTVQVRLKGWSIYHLLPSVHYKDYKDLSKLVQETCKQFNVPYNASNTCFAGFYLYSLFLYFLFFFMCIFFKRFFFLGVSKILGKFFFNRQKRGIAWVIMFYVLIWGLHQKKHTKNTLFPCCASKTHQQ